MTLHPGGVIRILLGAILILSAVVDGTAASPATPGASPSANAAFPDSPVGDQLEWVLAQFDDGAQHLSEVDIVARFTPAFLEQVPAADAVAFAQQFAAAAAPVVYQGVARPPTEHEVIGLIEGRSGDVFTITIVVEPEPPYQINELLIEPALQPIPQPITESGEFSGLYDIGGRSLYLNCTGSGSPTVILESGYNTPTSNWLGIQSAITPITRVCSYDRANVPLGASDHAATPRTGSDVVADLHTLLETAQVPGPYVLVGHSIGGIFGRLYASAYPDDVAGLVLVDSSHEEQDLRLRTLLTDEQLHALDEQSAGFPDAEGLDFDATFAEMRTARSAAPLRPIPLIVLTAGAASDPSGFPPGFPVDAYDEQHLELQADLVKLVPGARQVIAKDSSHFVQNDQPKLVIESIEQVVNAVRDPATWATPTSGTPTA